MTQLANFSLHFHARKTARKKSEVNPVWLHNPCLANESITPALQMYYCEKLRALTGLRALQPDLFYVCVCNPQVAENHAYISFKDINQFKTEDIMNTVGLRLKISVTG